MTASVQRPRLAALVVSIALAACGSHAATSPTQPGAPVTAATVNATPAIAFTPPSVSLAVGGTVTFAFGSVGHNVFFDGAPPGAPAPIDGVNANSSVTRTFTTPGVYRYDCHIHPGMRGTIIVGATVDSTTHTDSTGYGSYSRIP